MKKNAIVFFIALLPSIIAGGSSPRAKALGDASAVLPENGILTTGNPAGLSILNDHAFYLAYNRPYAGIGDPLGFGDIGYAHQFRNLDIGLALDYFQSRMYYNGQLGLSVSRNFGGFAVGLRFIGLFDSFRSDYFDYGEGDNTEDPVFDNGYGKLAFTGDFGLLWQANDKLRIGLGAFNLVDPDIALDTGNESRIGRDFDIAGSYNIGHYGTAFAKIGYNLESPNDNGFGFGAGFETDIVDPRLKLRAGFSDQDASLGLGFRLPTEFPLRIDYVFSYPFNDLGKISTSHGFGIAGFIEPKIRRPDLTVKIETNKERYSADETPNLTIDVFSYGLKTSRAAVAIKGIIGDQIAILDTLVFENIPADGSKKTDIEIPLSTVESTGDWTIFAEIDPLDQIRERNEDNNSSSAEISNFPPPSVSLSVSPKILEFQEIDYVYQDESIVPVVFFDRGQSKIDSRFDPLMDLLSQRLNDNPDAVFKIDGYYDPETEEGETELADKRENNLIEALTERSPSATDRILHGNKPSEGKRIERISQFEQYQLLINQENRRAEITIDMPDVRYEYKSNEISDREITQAARDLEAYLLRNPYSMVVIRASQKESSLYEALRNSLDIKRKLDSKFTANLQDRVIASASDDVQTDYVEIFLSGDPILYKPREIHSALSYEPQVFADCVIGPEVKSPLDIEKWQLYLQSDGRPMPWNIISGEGIPPETIEWDWRDPEGGLMPFGQRFTMCLDVTDELGQNSNVCIEKSIGTDVSRLEQRTDRLLLVQFIFDAPAPQSQYLRDRLEWVARHIIEKGEIDQVALSAELQGHTDEIGGKRRNIELSTERAKSVEHRLRIYMQALLGLPDSSDLQTWMDENEVTIQSKGYADQQPYTLELWKGGTLNTETVGDNTRPEGRAINRRVIIEIQEKREKGGDNE